MKKYNVTVNGTVYEVEIEEVDGFAKAPASKAAPAPAPKSAPEAAKVEPAPSVSPAKSPAASGAKAVKAPMPGTIVKVNVSEGQSVTKGTLLAVLEAMKMENDILAPADGVIASVNVSKGASVGADDIIVTMN